VELEARSEPATRQFSWHFLACVVDNFGDVAMRGASVHANPHATHAPHNMVFAPQLNHMKGLLHCGIFVHHLLYSVTKRMRHVRSWQQVIEDFKLTDYATGGNKKRGSEQWLKAPFLPLSQFLVQNRTLGL
jgi:hypothetical protein